MGLLTKKAPPVTYYHLEELADCWLSPQAIKSGNMGHSEKIKTLTALEWEFEACRQFWHNYVLPNINVLDQSGMLPAIQSLLQILDDSKDFPSVDRNDPETPDRYKVLTGVTLRDHSINVAQKTIDYMRRNHPDFQPLLGKTIIATLAHDLGVMIQEVGGVPHAINSARWCQNKLSGKKGMKEVVETVRHHHAKNKDIPKNNPILLSLMRFNEETRLAELAKYEEKNARQASQVENAATVPDAVTDDAAKGPEEPSEAIVEAKPENEPAAQPEVDKDSCQNPFADPVDTVIDQDPPADNESLEKEKEGAAVDTAEPACAENPPAPPEQEVPAESRTPSLSPAPERKQWLTQDELYGRLVQRLSPVGFDAFVFEGAAYFKPKVVREVLLALANENGGDELVNLMVDLIDHLVEKFGFVNNQAKLKFTGKMPPHKAYFFTIDKSKLPLPADFEELAPREIPNVESGAEEKSKSPRFLKKIVILK